MHFKPSFVEKYSALTDFTTYATSVMTFPRKSLRVNTLKTSARKVLPLLHQQGWQTERVPWCRTGYYLFHPLRRDIGNTPEHQQGLFFVQKSVSMIPPLALNPQPGEKVLDMCAAPGGKTTHLAALMQNKGIIIANERDNYRVNGLIANLERCGVKNGIVTTMNALSLPPERFDRILLDAPCSGTGLIKGVTRRSLALLKAWNQNYINAMSRVQKRMIAHAFSLLKDKGILVYSTCSLEPEENEDVVDHLLSTYGGTLRTISLPVNAESKRYLRMWPQDNNTEGFFVAAIRK